MSTGWDSEVLGSIPVDHTNIWKAGECTFDEISGVNALYLKCRGEGVLSLLSFELLH